MVHRGSRKLDAPLQEVRKQQQSTVYINFSNLIKISGLKYKLSEVSEEEKGYMTIDKPN